MMTKCYSELIELPTFEARYAYLRLGGKVGVDTFGFDRIFNQMFYHSKEWGMVRDKVIVRDKGRDLAMFGYDIKGAMMIHHINPITMRDIEQGSPLLLDPENLIVTTMRTHNAIHYGDESLLITLPPERKMNDTCPWRN